MPSVDDGGRTLVVLSIAEIYEGFWAATTKSDTDVKGLGLLERQRVKMWLRNAYEQIDSVGA